MECFFRIYCAMIVQRRVWPLSIGSTISASYVEVITQRLFELWHRFLLLGFSDNLVKCFVQSIPG